MRWTRKSLFYYEHLCNCSLPRDVDHAIASMKRMHGQTWRHESDPLPPCPPCTPVNCRPAFSEREVKAPNLDGGGDIREFPVVPEQRAATYHPVSPRIWELAPAATRLLTPSFAVYSGRCTVYRCPLSASNWTWSSSRSLFRSTARRIPILWQVNHGRVLGMSRHRNTEPPFQSFSKYSSDPLSRIS